MWDRAGAAVENGRRRREKRVEAIGAAKGIGISVEFLEFLVSRWGTRYKSGGKVGADATGRGRQDCD